MRPTGVRYASMSGQGTLRAGNAGSVESGGAGALEAGHAHGSRLQTHANGATWSWDRRSANHSLWICNVVPALSVSAYHTCCDRTRAPQGCGAQRNVSSKGTYMCGGCGPRVGARGPGHTQRHCGACTLGGAREHGLAKPHRVSGPWGGTRAGARGTIP
jgi:hypothetical protein